MCDNIYNPFWEGFTRGEKIMRYFVGGYVMLQTLWDWGDFKFKLKDRLSFFKDFLTYLCSYYINLYICFYNNCVCRISKFAFPRSWTGLRSQQKRNV